MRIAISAVLLALTLGGCAVETKLNGSPFIRNPQESIDREKALDAERNAIIQRLKRENPRLGPVELHQRAQEELQAHLHGPATAYTSVEE